MVDIRCPWCGRQLVHVDNPMRVEIRHRRGEEQHCPGSPSAEILAAVDVLRTADTITTADPDRPPILAIAAPLADFLESRGRELADSGNRIGSCDEPGSTETALTLARVINGGSDA